MKFKWLFPFLPFFFVGIYSIKDPIYWPPIETRIMYIVGCVVYMVIMLTIIQPWRNDESKVS